MSRRKLTAGELADRRLARIKAKCLMDCDCWLWQGRIQSGIPRLGKTTARRAIHKVIHGTYPESLLTYSCECSTCVNPEHTRKTTTSEARLKGAAQTDVQVRRAAALARAARAKSTKMTMEKARAIRESDKTYKNLADEYGISWSMAQAIGAGRRWKDYSNPFAALMK